MERWKRLLEQASAKAREARLIAEKADTENREMTEAERSDFTAKFTEAKALQEQSHVAKNDDAVLAEAKTIADLTGLSDAVKDDLDAQGQDPTRAPAGKSLGRTVVESAAFKNLMAPFGGSGNKDLRIPERIQIQSDQISFKSLIGQKTLFTGGSPTSGGAFVVHDRTDIVEMLGRRPLTVRDLVSVRTTQSDTVEFVQQVSHVNNAAPVAEATSSAPPTTGAAAGAALVLDPNGGYKPEGAWAFQVASATVKTIAEWVPATKRALADVGQLEGLINDELQRDLAEAEETQIVSGNGTGQNVTGILNTSGIQTMAATVTNDATWFASFRSAVTKLRTIGRVNPSAVLVNPVQGEKIDTSKDAQNRFYGAGPFGATPVRTLWGVPVIESESIPAGTAVIGDFSKAVLWDREQANVTMTNSHADFFIRNLVAILAEERVAFAVTRPSAFCTVTGL